MRDHVNSLVIRYEDASLLSGVGEDDLIIIALTERVHGPHDVPARPSQAFDDRLADMVVRQEQERLRHYWLRRRERYSIRSRSMSASTCAPEAKSASISSG